VTEEKRPLDQIMCFELLQKTAGYLITEYFVVLFVRIELTIIRKERVGTTSVGVIGSRGQNVEGKDKTLRPKTGVCP
jgi:hypothetical protein